jgi:hypothetical protein
MNSWKKFALAGCAGILGLAVVPSSRADVWNKKTILTVNESIQVPGKVLPPGKYVMKLAESPSNRHIVQVFNEREDQILATVLAIPNYRLQPTGDTKFSFWETAPGEPKPLRSWFYPGDNFGQEFVYPKDRAVMIAQYTKETVPTTTATTESEFATAKVAAVTPEGVEGELDRSTYTRQETTAQDQTANQQVAQATPQSEMPRQTQTAQAEMPRQTQTAQAEMPRQTQAAAQENAGADRERLPDTASPVPMIGLVGLLSLAASAGLRAVRR